MISFRNFRKGARRRTPHRKSNSHLCDNTNLAVHRRLHLAQVYAPLVNISAQICPMHESLRALFPRRFPWPELRILRGTVGDGEKVLSRMIY